MSSIQRVLTGAGALEPTRVHPTHRTSSSRLSVPHAYTHAHTASGSTTPERRATVIGTLTPVAASSVSPAAAAVAALTSNHAHSTNASNSTIQSPQSIQRRAKGVGGVGGSQSVDLSPIMTGPNSTTVTASRSHSPQPIPVPSTLLPLDYELRLAALEKKYQHLLASNGGVGVSAGAGVGAGGVGVAPPSSSSLSSRLDALDHRLSSVESQVQVRTTSNGSGGGGGGVSTSGLAEQIATATRDQIVPLELTVKRLEVRILSQASQIKLLQDTIQTMQHDKRPSQPELSQPPSESQTQPVPAPPSNNGTTLSQHLLDRERTHASQFSSLTSVVGREFQRLHERVTRVESERDELESRWRKYMHQLHAELRGILTDVHQDVHQQCATLETELRTAIAAAVETATTTREQQQQPQQQQQNATPSDAIQQIETRVVAQCQESLARAHTEQRQQLSTELDQRFSQCSIEWKQQLTRSFNELHQQLQHASTASTDALRKAEEALAATATTKEFVQHQRLRTMSPTQSLQARQPMIQRQESIPMATTTTTTATTTNDDESLPAGTAAVTTSPLPSSSTSSHPPAESVPSIPSHLSSSTAVAASDMPSAHDASSSVPSVPSASNPTTSLIGAHRRNASSTAVESTAARMKSQIKLPSPATHATTVTPASVSSSVPIASPSSSPTSSTAHTSTPSPGASPTAATRDTEWAAVRIQSVYRGYDVRRTMKRASTRANSDSASPPGDVILTHLDALASASVTALSPLPSFLRQVRQVSVGLNHVAIVLESGRVYMMGENASGQLGLGHRSYVTEPTALLALEGRATILQASCSYDHTVWRCADGRSYACGSGMFGRLGLGDGVDGDYELPQLLTHLPSNGRVIHIATGQYNSAWIVELNEEKDGVVKHRRQLYIAGANEDGQCGSGDRTPQFMPHLVQVIEPSSSPSSSSSSSSSSRLSTSSPTHISNSPTSFEFTRIGLGDKHTIGITSAGQVFGWGSNEFGALGLGRRHGQDRVTTSTSASNPNPSLSHHMHDHPSHHDQMHHPYHHYLTPTRIDFFDMLPTPLVDVVCGERHTHVLTSLGDIWSFGAGDSHQLGVMDNVDQFRPVKVEIPSVASSSSHIVSISTGQSLSFALTSNGEVYGWGYGLETPVPKLQSCLNDSFVQSIEIGSNDMIGLLRTDRQECYRWEFDPSTPSVTTPSTPTSATSSMSLALASPNSTLLSRPKRFEQLNGKRLQAVAVGTTHYGFIDVDGRLHTCGANSDYQLGTGNTIDFPMPIPISVPVRLTTLACSHLHSLALGEDGTVWSWGNSEYGRCGLGTDGDVKRPTRLDSIAETPMKFIVTGQYNSGCIARESGTIYTWGSDVGGQLGLVNSEFLPQLRPVPIPLIDPVTHAPLSAVSLAFGNQHAACVTNSGAAMAWGQNTFGACGFGRFDKSPNVQSRNLVADGTSEQSNQFDAGMSYHRPTHLSLLADVPLAKVYAGENVTFFLSRTGVLYSVGSGETAQLGISATSNPTATHTETESGVSEDQPIPTRIKTIADSHQHQHIIDMSVGTLNCVALSDDGVIWAWGWNIGEIPVIIKSLTDKRIKLVSCGATEMICST